MQPLVMDQAEAYWRLPDTYDRVRMKSNPQIASIPY